MLLIPCGLLRPLCCDSVENTSGEIKKRKKTQSLPLPSDKEEMLLMSAKAVAGRPPYWLSKVVKETMSHFACSCLSWNHPQNTGAHKVKKKKL